MVLTASDVRCYLARSGVSTLQKYLFHSTRKKNIAELLAFGLTIKSELPDLARDSGFVEYLEKFKVLKVISLADVWSTPASYHWNSMMREFLKVVIHHAAIPDILSCYLKFLEQSFEQGLRVHLNDFGRFVLAAFFNARLPVRLNTTVFLKLPNMLPGTGIAFLPDGLDDTPITEIALSALDQKTIAALAGLQKAGGSCPVILEGESGKVFKVIACKIPIWDGPCGKTELDSFEPCLNLPYVEAYPRVQSVVQSKRFFETLKRALHHLARHDPGVVDEISFITASITPMSTDGIDAEMCSGSASYIFGACFLSVTDEPMFMAEMLLHEFCHNKLRLLEDFVRLVVPESPVAAKYYSPWRDDPRPLDGIQHGLFVFGRIARFWLSVWNNPETSARDRALAQQRVGTLLYQLQYASVELTSHAVFTDYGRAFLDEVNSWIHDLEMKTQAWNYHDIRPLFSGVVKDKSLKTMPIIEALPRHRSCWESSYRS